MCVKIQQNDQAFTAAVEDEVRAWIPGSVGSKDNRAAPLERGPAENRELSGDWFGVPISSRRSLIVPNHPDHQ